MGENTKLVRNTRKNGQSSLVDRLRRFIKRTKTVEIPLDFWISTDDQGRHVIKVFMTIAGERRKVENIGELWTYGFIHEENNIRYILSGESLETLLAIRSLNPKLAKDGTIVSEVYPSVLKYLRKRTGINEDESSKRFKIEDFPLKHRAKVTFNPSEGLHVVVGYEVPGQDDVVKLSDFAKSPDKEYVRLRDTFYHLPEEEPKVRKWVEAQKRTIELEGVPDFFKRDLILLRSDFHAVLTEPAERIKIIEQRFQPKFHLKTDGRGWLDFTVNYKIGDYKLPLDFFKGHKSDFVQPDQSTWIRVDRSSVDKVSREIENIDPVKTTDGYRVDIARFQSVEEAIEHLGGDRKVSSEYQHFLDKLTDFKPNSSFKLPSDHEEQLTSKGIALRPYQRAGIYWLNWLANHHLHGILADDMGLGKTIQSIATLRLMYETTNNSAHSLIICPKSVVGHWVREIKRVFPAIGVSPYLGKSRDGFVFTRRKPTIFITTYEIQGRDIDILERVPFFFLILDEGTRIKSPEAKRTLAAKTLNAAHRVVLSGTPIENRPLELWSMFDFLIRGHLGSHGHFISKFEKPLQDGDNKVADTLAKRIKPFILRRLKEEVAKDLPEKIEMNYWCGMTEEQKALYGQLQDRYLKPVRSALQKGEYVSYTNIFQIITKLKQVCDHPALITGRTKPITGRSEKFDLIIETIKEICDKGESAVVFTHFLGVLDLFETYFRDNKINYIRIDGSTQNRQELIDRFNLGGSSIAICSLMAASHGINLTSASHVIHVDRWWNPAVEDQATDRVHRIGQTNIVYIYKILTEGTLEEKIDSLLEEKKGLSDKVMTAAMKGAEGWTREELLEILKPTEA